MRVPIKHSNSRRIALLATIGLHLLGCVLIGHALHAPQAPQPAGPAMVWLGWPDAGAVKSAPAPPIMPQPRTPAAAVAAARVPSHVVPLLPSAPAPAPPATNWRLEAERAAMAVLSHSAADQRRDGAMGLIPMAPFKTASVRPEFPWSRQPLGKHFDADPRTGIVSVSGKRCTLAFFLILPGFGCAVGHLDPEPGRGDLFDPKYRPQPLELPDSLSTVH